MTPGAPFSEVDLFLTASAGNWSQIPDATEAELDLAAQLASLERELRDRLWGRLEALLPHAAIVDGRVRVAAPAGPEGIRAAIAVYELGWVDGER